MRNQYVYMLLLLSACTGSVDGGFGQVLAGQTPVVKAVNGGSAELILEACTTPTDAKEIQEVLTRMISALQIAGVLVASSGSAAKLTINLCGG